MVFKPVRIGDKTIGSDNIFNDLGALTALTTFNCVNKHYTYTLRRRSLVSWLTRKDVKMKACVMTTLMGAVRMRHQTTEI